MSAPARLSSPAKAIPAERRWFLGVPTWIRASGNDSKGKLSVVDQMVPPGFSSPWHVHHDEDETFCVIEGSMTVVVGDQATTLNAGDVGFGPRGIAHGFRIEGDKPARILLMTNSGGLAAFIREMSVPAQGEVAPALDPADLPKFAAAAERHGMNILGPMPSA